MPTKPLPKSARTDARCVYDFAFSTFAARPLLTAEMHGLIADRLADLEERDDLTITTRTITPSSVTLRVLVPPTISPNAAVSRIKASLHRAIVAVHPGALSRTPSIFTRAAYIRSVGTPPVNGAVEFLARERGQRAA